MKLKFFDMDNKLPMATEGSTEAGWLVPGKDAVVHIEGRYWEIRVVVYRYELGEVHIRLNPM